ncbi:hydrolase [Paenibacillus sp. 598K]|nr:hydrolase [Paenibacillus sp. 598K]
MMQQQQSSGGWNKVQMQDGVMLATYIERPTVEGDGKSDGEGPWPVIVSRTPYPMARASWLQAARMWAGHGYVFVLQECRGTGDSEGEWQPFRHERADGLDTLQWIVGQSWCNGRIATYGSSYHGTLQWSMAGALPEEVKTMYIAFAGIHRYAQHYMNGMFRHDIYTVWALGNSGAEIDHGDFGALYRQALAARPHLEMDEQVLGTQLPWYREWITEVDPASPYWTEGFWAELKEMPRRVTVPLLMVAGWYDHNLQSGTWSYASLPETIRQKSCLLIGPWVHTESTSGDLAYPGHDIWGARQVRAALAWFDHHLKDRPLPVELAPGTVQTYAIREDRWIGWQGMPTATKTQTWYLAVGDAPAHPLVSDPPMAGQLSYVYDPGDPVPTRGGAALMHYLTGDTAAAPPSSVRQEPPGTRADVLSFVSEPLGEELRIAGPVKVWVEVATDADDTAFTAQLIEQCPDGSAYHIRDGITSLRWRSDQASTYSSEERVVVAIELWPIVWLLRPGSRLRLDVSSSNFPAYHAHSNQAGPWAAQTTSRAATQTVYTAGLSRIELPLSPITP